MKVRKQALWTVRTLRLPLAPLGITIIALLLCAGRTSAQCSVDVAPGEKRSLQASNGDTTPFTPATGPSGFFAQGAFYLNENKVEADAVLTGGALGFLSASAFAQINYQFCVPGKREDSINATILGEAEWNGILFVFATLGSGPKALVTASLLDLGTDGTDAPIELASQTLLDSSTKLTSVKGISLGGSIVTGSMGLNMTNVPITTGHVYEIQFKLECDVPSGLVSVGGGCIFGSDLPINISNLTIPTLVDYAKLSNLTVRLSDDPYGAILSVGEAVAALAKQVETNSHVELDLERENAQLLGILNEIKTLLTALQSDPPISKTSDPKLPIRPARPRTMDPP
jgi:hypothetical protein